MIGRYPVSNGLYDQPHGGWRLNPAEQNLVAHPLEHNNLPEKLEHAVLLQVLDASLTDWMRCCGDPALRGPTLAPRWKHFLNEVKP